LKRFEKKTQGQGGGECDALAAYFLKQEMEVGAREYGRVREVALGFVVSHPFRRKKRKGWGTVVLGLFPDPYSLILVPCFYTCCTAWARWLRLDLASP
jgi:hypothetical protein